MKKILFALAFFCVSHAGHAQTYYSQADMFNQMAIDFNVDSTPQNSSFDNDPPNPTQRIAYPKHDYTYNDGSCVWIYHAYRHSFLGIPFGPIYYDPELVGCI